jgi:myo-inositol-1(or 4)-monophosphatase
MDFGNGRSRKPMCDRAMEILRRAGQIRCTGSAVVGILQVAMGEYDGFIHMRLHPWDYAAAQLVAEEAGGMASRLDGSPLGLFDGGKGVLITNSAIHQEMLSLVANKESLV